MRKPPPYNTLSNFILDLSYRNKSPELAQISQILQTAAAIHCLKIVIKRFSIHPLVNFADEKARRFDGGGPGVKWKDIKDALEITANYNYHDLTSD